MIGLIIGLAVIVIIGFSGIRIVRPTHKLLVETLGKFSREAEQGFNWIFPIIQSVTYVNITEQMVDIPEQVVQTADKLNTRVDAVVYYKIKNAPDSVYNVDDHETQLTSLARTTLRAVMGKLTLPQCIQESNKINEAVEKVLEKETNSYGVNVLRVEVQRIEPPRDVQVAMNEVVKAEQKKIAAKDFATATETQADGERMALIKMAEGNKESEVLIAEGRKKATILKAEGEAKGFDLIEKSFKEKSQKLKAFEVTQASLENNTKVVITEKGISPKLIMDAMPFKNV